MMRRILEVSGTLLIAMPAALLLAGCSKAPQADLQAAEEAVLAARTSEAEVYAQDAMTTAQDALNEARTEIAAQDSKWLKNFDRARELLTEARASAEQAKSAAVVNRDQTRIESQAAIAEAKMAIDDAASVLGSAPVGKGTRADIALYTSDLEQLRSEIIEAETDLAAENFRDALDKANAVRDKAERIDADVRSVIDRKRGGRRA